ncbi:hypothetical protein KKC56_01605 [Patescibacteria group bacterium]|nr:hypothetical protein [Patescibacteria group bacterium]MBU1778125.1 hypothetical protein [Patescibacteria group bacterium]
MKKIIKYSSVAIVSLMILFGTLSIPKTVYNKTDMEAVKLGYPISFVTQNFTRLDPPFPWKYSFGSPWEDPFKISWFNFLLSYLIIFLVMGLAATGIEKLFIKIRKK